jgi:cell division septal protein FtsQ
MSFPAAIDLRRLRRGDKPAKPAKQAKAKSDRRFQYPNKWVLLAWIVAAIALLAGLFMLVRNTPLVEVREVAVTGLSEDYDESTRSAVIDEARNMTTLNFSVDRIKEAAAEFADVSSVEVTRHIPHGVSIDVQIRRPVLLARVSGKTVLLAQTGEVMDVRYAAPGLPKLDVTGRVVDGRLAGGKGLSAVKVLGAAPQALMAKVKNIRFGKLGVVVGMDGGLDLYFGSAKGATRKWQDAATVLASGKASGAAYLDLRVPGRVAIGGLGGAALPQTQKTDETAETVYNSEENPQPSDPQAGL